MPTVDPQIAAILERMEQRPTPPFETLSATEARALSEELNRYWNEAPLPVAEVREIEAADVRVRLYRPENATEPSPCLVWLHGGGWVIGSLDTHDGLCRRLALAGGMTVASIDYRMAPEHPFPTPLDDTLAALAGLRAQAAALRIDPQRVALGGDSAGANLALAACLALRDRGQAPVRAAILVYGAFSDDLDSPSHLAFGDGRWVLSTPTMRWFWDQYVPDVDRRREPLVSPLWADLRGLPPLYVSAAELDPLRDDSERLARRLVEAGVDIDWRLWRGVTHACINWGRDLDAARRYIAEIAAFIARRLV